MSHVIRGAPYDFHTPAGWVGQGGGSLKCEDSSLKAIAMVSGNWRLVTGNSAWRSARTVPVPRRRNRWKPGVEPRGPHQTTCSVPWKGTRDRVRVVTVRPVGARYHGVGWPRVPLRCTLGYRRAPRCGGRARDAGPEDAAPKVQPLTSGVRTLTW